MTRTIFAAASAFAFIGVLAGPGCKASGVGDPCTPEQEYDKGFNGFAVDEVNVESKSFQCQTRLCLVNHFRGRVTCPYGQSTTGEGKEAPGGAKDECKTPAGVTVDGKDKDGNVLDEKKLAEVTPQCADRTADKAVYCSCRCANVDGNTNDGASYCTCPDGFACEQLVTSIGSLDTGLTGGYCIKTGTKFDRNNNCASDCGKDKPCK